MITFPELDKWNAGYGNQMFRYVFLRTTARRLGVQFYCKPWAGDEVFHLDDTAERAEKLEPVTREYKELEPTCGFQKDALRIQDGTRIFGYFETEKYFTEPSEIRKWFMFQEGKIARIQKQYNDIDFAQSVSLSLRLGDDFNQLRWKYPLYGASYYEKALAEIEHKKFILVFSDRMDRAQRLLRNLKDKQFIFIENCEWYEQMYLASLCRDNIITNSTFSWWSAWLNAHPDKKVILPKHWFTPGCGFENPDVACRGWRAFGSYKNRCSPQQVFHIYADRLLPLRILQTLQYYLTT